MVAIPSWLLGKQVTTLTVTAQDIAASGTITNNAGGAKDIKVRLNSIRLAMPTEMEDISPVTTGRVNMVNLAEGVSITVEELMVNDGSAPVSHLAALAFAFDVFKVIFARGSLTWTAYVRRGEYSENVNSRGKVVATLELHPVDAAADTVTYA